MSSVYVDVITVDDGFLTGVFTGINLPINEWQVNISDDPSFAMHFRTMESSFYNMLEGVFPQHKFGIKSVLKYKPCVCTVKDFS
jgi:hypothetical protein